MGKKSRRNRPNRNKGNQEMSAEPAVNTEAEVQVVAASPVVDDDVEIERNDGSEDEAPAEVAPVEEEVEQKETVESTTAAVEKDAASPAPAVGFISEIESSSEESDDNEIKADADAEVSTEEAESTPGAASATTDSNNGPRPIVIAGPSGTGKGTLISILMSRYPNEQFGFSVSHTTRQPREGEQDTVHYNFTTVPDIQADIADGKFIEYAEVHGNYYGTSVQAVKSVQGQGRVCILDIDVQGVQLVKKSELDPYFVFIAPPSMEQLEERLRGRGTEKEEDIEKRLANAKGEMDYGQIEGNFDKYLVNDNLEKASEDLCNTVEAWFSHLQKASKNDADAVDEDDKKDAKSEEALSEEVDQEAPDDEADAELSETQTEVIANTKETIIDIEKIEGEHPDDEETDDVDVDEKEDLFEDSNDITPEEITVEVEVAEPEDPATDSEEHPDDESENTEPEPSQEDSEVVEEVSSEVPDDSAEDVNIEGATEPAEEVTEAFVEEPQVEEEEITAEVAEEVAEPAVEEPEVISPAPQDQLEPKEAPAEKVEPATVETETMKESVTESKDENDVETTDESPPGKYYTIEELRYPIDGVNWSDRENYLSDSDIQKLFNMSRSELKALPLWKRNAAKKKLHIF